MATSELLAQALGQTRPQPRDIGIGYIAENTVSVRRDVTNNVRLIPEHVMIE